MNYSKEERKERKKIDSTKRRYRNEMKGAICDGLKEVRG
jgi:hypothetical protein